MADRKLDLNAILNALDKRDGDWLSRQSADAQKEFAPIVMLRFGSTVSDGEEAPVMLWRYNERVNANLFDLGKHPDLAFRLMASCGLGVRMSRPPWLAGHKRPPTTNKAYALLIQHHPNASDLELEFLMARHTKASFADFVSDCGIQPAEAKDILKAYEKITKD